MTARRTIAALTTAAGVAGALAGLAAAAPSAAADSTVKVTLGKPSELRMIAAPARTKAGKVTFVVTNVGKAPHEMVVVPLAAGQAKPPTKNGRAVEKGALGEAPEMGSGRTKTITLTLKKGRYSLICNVPGHYLAGMLTTLTVS